MIIELIEKLVFVDNCYMNCWRIKWINFRYDLLKSKINLTVIRSYEKKVFWQKNLPFNWRFYANPSCLFTSHLAAEVYLEPSGRSMVEIFARIVNCWKPLQIKTYKSLRSSSVNLLIMFRDHSTLMKFIYLDFETSSNLLCPFNIFTWKLIIRTWYDQ